MDIEIENHIIGEIYDAAVNLSLWPEILKKIVDYTASKTAILTVLDLLNPKYNIVFTYNIPQASIDAYQDENVKAIDMKLHVPLWDSIGVGGVMHFDLSHYASSTNADKQEFYEKCLKITGISYIAAVLLDKGEYRWSVLGIHREAVNQEFSHDEMMFFQRLGVHIRRSLQIYKQLSFAQTMGQNLFQILDLIKIGIILIDEDKVLKYSNKAAQALLEQSKLFEFDQKNRLLVRRDQQAKFEKTVQSAFYKRQDTHHDIGGVLELKAKNGQDYMLSITPLSSIQHLIQIEQGAFAVLFLSEKQQQYSLSNDYLKETFALTTRECEMCVRFVNGANMEDIATQCSLTISSVRTYFKNIFAKTQSTTQVELMRKLMSLSMGFEHIV
ncbi:LuxR family transcriptional regulator [Acinetobacter cumulans]|uniref:LuxR family transcriptional regulator n=1 Tax=Acinetobacter cumulans TaxID=2136182 RepID=A0ABX9U4P0_9GAMM|nr:LuxR C-terminal-related transcriptional regulator [Acinetobacter cumulans]RLL41976.1 LuxR family transcriptional regulator [Acinetobacter cumulans]